MAQRLAVSRRMRRAHHFNFAHAAGGDLQALQHELLRDPQRAVAGVGQRMVEHRLLDRGNHPVGVRRAGAG